MMRLGDLIVKQSKALLENKQHAILGAVVLSMLPFTTWLAVALVALVTLRKGGSHGFEVMLAALVFHSVPLMLILPLSSVLINTLITFVPAFIAAKVLRDRLSWPAVFGALFLQVALVCLSLQLLVPHFVIDQFNQFKTLLNQYPEYQQLMELSTEGMSHIVLAQLFFGMQLFSVVVSATISLMCARSIQAKLFIPGGFREEVLAFRAGRLAFLVLLSVAIAAYYQSSVAINLLPMVLSYFILSGFGLAHFILGRKNQIRVLILLVLLLLVKPTFMVFA
ncbi:MAG: hypothetical protein EPN84_12150, partial [Legionella sp.]